MKKIIPLFILCSLGLSLPSVPTSKEVINLEASNALQTTYLVLTENGLYNGEKGENNPDLFLENCVTYQGQIGDELPGSDVITNKVSGVTFAGWIRYNSNGVPEGVNKISETNELIVYASWTHDGSNLPNGGGNQGGGDVPSGETMRVYFKSKPEWTNANIYYWQSGNEGPNAWPGVAMNKDSDTGLWYYDYDTTRYDNVIFNNGTAQTENLKSPTSEDADCYVWNNGWYNEDTSEQPKEIEAGMIYFKPNSNWQQASAWFAAWTWGSSSSDSWIIFEDTDNDGIYEAELEAGKTGMKIVRMNPSVSEPSWDSGKKWNETSDLTIPTNGNNMFTLTEGLWDNATGTWSTFNG